METYVPSEPLPGILGAVSSTGELDGIQAWKKGLKDKEKEKEEKDKSESALPTPSTKEKETLPSATGPGLDEIQLFRLMMQKEQGKKDPEPTTGPSSETALASTSNYSGGCLPFIIVASLPLYLPQRLQTSSGLICPVPPR